MEAQTPQEDRPARPSPFFREIYTDEMEPVEPIRKTGQIETFSDSMYPYIFTGDTLFIREFVSWREFLIWNEIYAVKINDTVLITRLFKGKDNQHLASIPDNKNYQAKELPISKIEEVFRVVGIFRRIAM